MAGASMGGMQGIQWAVSYPNFMESVIALTGAARASAWFAGVLYVRNNILVGEGSWNDEKYRDQLERGWKAFAALSVLVGAAPERLNHLFPNGKEIVPYLKAQGEAKFSGNPMPMIKSINRMPVSTMSGKAPGSMVIMSKL